MSDLTASLPEHLQPPMENGEVIFQAPWEGRVFAMAVALHEAGVFPWMAFQTCLIEEIAAWERVHDDAAGYPYFELFGQALQTLLATEQVIGEPELNARASTFAARASDHDHPHEH